MPVELLPLAATLFASAAKLTVVAGLVLAAFALGRLSAQRERSQDHEKQRAMWFARLSDADGGRRRALWSLHRREETIRTLEQRLGGPVGGASAGPLESEPDGGPFAALLRDPVGITEGPGAASGARVTDVMVATGPERGADLAVEGAFAADETAAVSDDSATDPDYAHRGELARAPISSGFDPFAGDDATWHLVDDLHDDDEPQEVASQGEVPVTGPLVVSDGNAPSAAAVDEPPAPLPAATPTEPEPFAALLREPLADVDGSNEAAETPAETGAIDAAGDPGERSELDAAARAPVAASTPPPTLVALTPIPPLPPLLTTAAEFDAAGTPAAPARALTPLPPLPEVAGEDEPTEAADDEPTHELAAAPRPMTSERAANRRISSPLAPLR